MKHILSKLRKWEVYHGLRSLAGYGPWGYKESDMIEQTNGLSLFEKGLLKDRINNLA